MRRRVLMTENVVIAAAATAVGREEGRGRYGEKFDFCDPSDRFGAKTWELAEGEMARIALNLALKKRGIAHGEIDLLFAGDLQNQCVASSCGLSGFGIPYVGLYGACSTSVEGLLASSLVLSTANGPHRAAVVTSSHNCAAERQFRTPIEYGAQRTPTAQWTATAAGAFILERRKAEQGEIEVKAGMAGCIFDGGISDAANMGAAMAPAACDTLLAYLQETGEHIEDADLIVTGDLGIEGGAIFRHLCEDVGIVLGDRYFDCGAMLYDEALQDVHGGGSGCGCAASVLAAHILPEMRSGRYRRVLAMATGALMSPSSVQQGESILGIAPLVVLERTS